MSVTGMPASARTFAVPPVDSSATPRDTRPRASSTMPDLSETDSSACATIADASVAAPARGDGSDKFVLGELRAKRIAVQSQHFRSVRLVAVRPIEYRCEERALDMRNHHVVNAMRWFAIEAAEVFVQRMLDAAADFVAAVQS